MTEDGNTSLSHALSTKLAQISLKTASVSTFAAEARKMVDDGIWVWRPDLDSLYLEISRLEEALRDLKYIRMRQERRYVEASIKVKA